MSRVLPGRISAGAAAEAGPDERAAGEAFTLEDGQRVFLRVAAVDGDRHVQLCSEPELGRKRRFLHVMRRAFRVGARVIQAYFPDGTDARALPDAGADEVERVLTERTRVVRVDAQQEEDFRMIPEKPGISRECFGVEKNIGHMREAALCGALQNFVAVFIECRIVHVGMRVDASGRESAVQGIDARRLLVLGHGLNLRASPSS